MSISLSQTSSSSKVVTTAVEIARGSRMTLSTACLDVDRFDYDRVKLEYRCVYPSSEHQGRDDDDDDFACLCNYLGAKNGGMGLMPCTTIGLDIVGPCRVEFRGDVVATGVRVSGTINVFGIVAPLLRDCEDGVASYAPDGGGGVGASAFRRSDSTFATGESEEREKVKFATENGAPPGKWDGDAGDIHDVAGATERWKMGHAVVDDDGAPSSERPPSDPRSGNAGETLPLPTREGLNDGGIMTKKERRQLAREKAEQLEETLSAARRKQRDDDATSGDAAANAADADDDVGDDEPAKKKSKRGKKDSDHCGGPKNGDPPKRTTSLTRERRLAGGLVVSDMLLGDGAPVKPGKRISLHYTGSLRYTGKVFDKNNSKQHPLVFRQGTGEVIRGKSKACARPGPYTIRNILRHYRSDQLLICYAFPLFLTYRVGTRIGGDESGRREGHYDTEQARVRIEGVRVGDPSRLGLGIRGQGVEGGLVGLAHTLSLEGGRWASAYRSPCRSMARRMGSLSFGRGLHRRYIAFAQQPS
jgi:FKBP-type peptidyl-prolyl cis-trans isomerase